MPSSPSSDRVAGPWYLRLEIWSVALALAGVGLAAYLTIVHYRESLLVCSGISDCETVQTSKYSEVAGIPVALMGLLMFVAILGLSIARLVRPEIADLTTMIIFVLVAAGIGFYIYLTYLELFVINAVCQWCVASSLATVGLMITESIMVRRVLSVAET